MPSSGSMALTSSEDHPVDLSKMTVPQLKALCKERRITGYSKLGKTALVQTLSEVITTRPVLSPLNQRNDPGVRGPAVVAGTPDSAKVHNSSRGSTEKHTVTGGVHTATSSGLALSTTSSNLTSTLESAVTEGSPTHQLAALSTPPRFLDPQLVGISSSNAEVISLGPRAVSTYSGRRPTVDNQATELNSKKRARDTYTRAEVPSKKPKTTHVTPPTPSLKEVTVVPVNASAPSAMPPISQGISLESETKSRCNAIPNTTSKSQSLFSSTGKRFRPLLLNKPLRDTGDAAPRPAIPLSAPSGVISGQDVPLRYLDFLPAPSTILVLSPISLPPSLSQRSRVQTWAVILSGLSGRERKQCVLVSRMVRYAVYLSASQILKQKFSGKRLERDTKKANKAMTNMWPYLRVRQAELSERWIAYKQSFVVNLFKGIPPVSSALWCSPDHDMQITVALRFAITRLWFSVSIGGHHNFDWLQGVVQDVQEVIPKEVWRVSIKGPQQHRLKVVYVLEPTCEVVGYATQDPSESQHGVDKVSGNQSLRADWSAYIQRRQMDEPCRNAQPLSLLSHLRWANYEEYDRGISKLWLKRIAPEGPLGDAKKTVAERYVLACVVSNGVSGQWMSTVQMAQEFASMTSRTEAANPKNRGPNLGLFLPGHHHVESVHFITPTGRLLHPALASVQTLHREYLVLRDNGMEVGCEEDGVSITWMNLLQCDSKGLPL